MLNNLILEWKIRIRMYLHGLRIVVKNPGIIKWSDGCHILRPGWEDRYSIKEMIRFGTDLK